MSKASNMERPNLWLALSGIPPDVIPSLLLMMKANRQQTDDPVLEMLQRMHYSQIRKIAEITSYNFYILLKDTIKSLVINHKIFLLFYFFYLHLKM